MPGRGKGKIKSRGRGNRVSRSKRNSGAKGGKGSSQGKAPEPKPQNPGSTNHQKDFYEILASESAGKIEGLSDRVKVLISSYEGHARASTYVDFYLENGVTEVRPMDLKEIGQNGKLSDGTDYGRRLELIANANRKYQEAEANFKDVKAKYNAEKRENREMEELLGKAGRALTRAKNSLARLRRDHQTVKSNLNYFKAGYKRWKKLRRKSPDEVRQELAAGGDGLDAFFRPTFYRPSGVPGPMTTMATEEGNHMLSALLKMDRGAARVDEITSAVDAVFAKYAPEVLARYSGRR